MPGMLEQSLPCASQSLSKSSLNSLSNTCARHLHYLTAASNYKGVMMSNESDNGELGVLAIAKALTSTGTDRN